jgi:MFS family permease
MDARALKRDWSIFTTLTFLFTYGFSIYSGVFQNFLRDVMHAGPLDLGHLESSREIPGLLAALMAGTLASLAEARIAGIGLVIGGLGIGLTGLMPNFAALIAMTVFWSVGFHLYVTVSPAITLALAKGKEGGRHLGRMSGVGGAATLAALASAWLVNKAFHHVSYDVFYAVAGTSCAAAGVLCMTLSTHAEGAPRARLIFRREYGLYYLLSFLEGCRRQIFSIFASFALILVYRVPLSAMLALQLINAVLISITAPRIGKIIDRVGERGPMAFYSCGLIVVFLGYASTHTVYALYALFLLDNILFSFSVGYTTYLHRIVRKDELTPCLAAGVTMNHIAAVTVPTAGAYLWVRYGNYQLPFWVGVALAVVALIANLRLPTGPHGEKSIPVAPMQEQIETAGY